jgi:uncharacterized membrane protein YhaH (DUF805 family)
MMSWYLMALRKYATFSGRAQRSEFWFFVATYLLILFLLAVVDGLLGVFDTAGEVGLLSGLFALAMVLPWLAVCARRLHDTGRSGWWMLVSFIPLIGSLVLLFFLVQDSAPGANAFGPNPKAG